MSEGLPERFRLQQVQHREAASATQLNQATGSRIALTRTYRAEMTGAEVLAPGRSAFADGQMP